MNGWLQFPQQLEAMRDELTPVTINATSRGIVYQKEDDLFGNGRGCKYRNFLRHADGATGIVTACSAMSPQQCFVNDTGETLGLPTVIFTPPRRALGETPEMQYVRERHHSELTTDARCTHHTYQHYAAKKYAAARGYVFIDNNLADLPSVSYQVQNLKDFADVKRIVVASGRGYALSSILIGLHHYGLKIPVLAVAVTDIRRVEKTIRRAMEWTGGAMATDVEIIAANTSAYREMVFEKDARGRLMDCGYEAKAWEFVRGGDLFWICGRRPLSVIEQRQREHLAAEEKKRRRRQKS